VDAARGLAAAIAEVDQQLLRLNRDRDSKEVERLDERLAALGPEDSSEDEEHREMRRLLSGQRDLLRRYESRAEQSRARREQALRLLGELWRRTQAAAQPGYEQLLVTAVAEAEAFVLELASPAEPSASDTATRVRPVADG
jgi:hypothetical protein